MIWLSGESLNIIWIEYTSKLITTQLETNRLKPLKPDDIIRLKYDNEQILERTSKCLYTQTVVETHFW